VTPPPKATVTRREPVIDPASGLPLAKEQPGYYPGFSTLDQQNYWDAATRKVVLKRVSETPPIRFFNPKEAATMLAVMDRILPQEDRVPERRIPLLPSLDDRLYQNRIDGYRYEDMPSDRDAYRLAARAFDDMAQTLHHLNFEELETIQQEVIIKSIHDGEPIAAKDIWDQMNVERFWALLVSDSCAAYYSHPWAWDEIGFGGPAYPRGYMRLEEGEPEPWEVNERRYEWTAPVDTISSIEEQHGTGAEHQSHPGQGGTH
jgi:hypothetical protein